MDLDDSLGDDDGIGLAEEIMKGAANVKYCIDKLDGYIDLNPDEEVMVPVEFLYLVRYYLATNEILVQSLHESLAKVQDMIEKIDAKPKRKRWWQ